MKKLTNTNNEARANTRGLISRSLTATKATLMVYVKADKKTVEADFTLQGLKTTDEIISAYNKAHIGEIALDVIKSESVTHLYAMDIDTFIANAKIMD